MAVEAPVPAPRPGLRRALGPLGGVCAGLAARWGLDPLVPRVVFLVASMAGGIGVAAYLLLWAAIPRDAVAAAAEPARRRRRRGSGELALGIGLLVLSVLLVFRAWGLWVGDVVAWPVVLVSVGAAVLWRQLSAPAGREPARPRTAAGEDERREVAATTPLTQDARGRALAGAALIAGGALVFLQLTGVLGAARDVVVTALVVLVAVLLILAPWWVRLWRGMDAERAERVRSQERAEVAAHLHDSVLQTLALVQARAEDPRAVAQLARRQERDLRRWLDGGRPGEAPASLAAALREAAAEVEDDHGAVVDVVTVGDRSLDPAAEALVAAAREALVNAARHAHPAPQPPSAVNVRSASQGGPGSTFIAEVALFLEVRGDRAEVFVRDRGVGFDPAAVPADRRGVRESIVGRMARHGGQATVHAAPGQGTEVELVLEWTR